MKTPWVLLLSLPAACTGPSAPSPMKGVEGAPPGRPSAELSSPRLPGSVGDEPESACRARVAEVLAGPSLPGAPAFDRARIAVLGRARGEPMVFVREPQRPPEAELTAAARASLRVFERGQPGGRVAQLRARHRGDPATLRALLLREGYAFTAEPLDALALVTSVTLADLFVEPAIWLQRGATTSRLERVTRGREVAYEHADGPLAHRRADLLFGDRVARDPAELAAPLHRDLRALAEQLGFERAAVAALTRDALVADLRFGDLAARAVLASDGAALSLACLAEPADVRAAVEAYRTAEAPRLRALAALRATVTEEVGEALRFDRPEGVTGADRDGELRPVWASAYLGGRGSFQVDGASYAVFDAAGRPSPPEVCVDFVLDSFERTAGTWFRPRGGPLGRVVGRLDFDEAKIPNRRGVLAFGAFAEAHPELFAVRRFRDGERVPSRDRAAFFAGLVARPGEVRAGDVVAIQGLKRDERIHQHAILVEATDPLTGFPYGLADQMKRPRRRTWEGIMAEAPARSLLYRVRPLGALVERLDPGE